MVSHARRGPRAICVVVLVAGLVLASGSSLAQDASREAEREYRLGFQALQKGDCTRALVHYQRSYQLAPRPRTLFNMAACQEDLGQDAEAWASYQTFLELAEARDAKIVKQARVRLDVLRGRLRGQVWVDTVPSGATVQVDGERESRGLTPVTLSLPPGVHLVRLSRPDAVAVERTVEVTPGGVSSLSVELALPSAITIQVEPEDAVIEPGDGGASTQGRFEAEVKPGRHQFTVRRDGYLTEHVVIDAVAGRTYEQRVSLRPMLTAARLVVEGAPGVVVTVDGEVAPGSSTSSGVMAMRDVSEGSHQVRVERAGHQPWSAAVQLAPGEVVTVGVDLAARPSSTRRSVGWTVGGLGVAGLAAGGVVGLLALRDVASPSPDDHERGKARALLADGLFVVGAAALVVAWRLLRRASPSVTIHRALEPAR